MKRFLFLLMWLFPSVSFATEAETTMNLPAPIVENKSCPQLRVDEAKPRVQDVSRLTASFFARCYDSSKPEGERWLADSTRFIVGETGTRVLGYAVTTGGYESTCSHTYAQMVAYEHALPPEVVDRNGRTLKNVMIVCLGGTP